MPKQPPHQTTEIDVREKAFVNTICGVSFCAFLMTFAVWVQGDKYPIVYRPDMFAGIPGLILAVSLVSALLLATLLTRWARRRCQYYKKFEMNVASLFIFTFPLWMGFVQVGKVINGVSATTLPRTISTNVVDRRILPPSRGERNPSYCLYLRDWLQPSKKVWVWVSQSQFETTPIGAPVKVVTHRGSLGHEILDSVTIQ